MIPITFVCGMQCSRFGGLRILFHNIQLNEGRRLDEILETPPSETTS